MLQLKKHLQLQKFTVSYANKVLSAFDVEYCMNKDEVSKLSITKVLLFQANASRKWCYVAGLWARCRMQKFISPYCRVVNVNCTHDDIPLRISRDDIMSALKNF